MTSILSGRTERSGGLQPAGRTAEAGRYVGLLLSLFLIAACGSESPRAAAETVAAPTEIVSTSALPETRITTGTVRSATVSPLAANVMGNVTRVLVSEGDRVRAGDVLLEIDDRAGRAKRAGAAAGSSEVDEAIAGANAAVAAAEANAALAEATYKRFAALRARGSASAQELDEVTARRSGADAQLAQAKRGRDGLLARRVQARAGLSEAETFLSYSAVRAPISGIVTARMIDPGAQAVPGMPLLTVEDDAHYRVETTIDEELAGRVRAGDAVTIDGVAARVTNIVPAVDPVTRSALVKIDLPRGAGLRSGAFVHVAFTIGTRSGITVPKDAIARRGQLTSVFVVDGSRVARMRLITLGDAHGERVEVLSGLDVGETIVPLVVNGLRDGVNVAAGFSPPNARLKPGATLPGATLGAAS
ncbi:MAG TPA: efflux RND transporter periplasmic adaptor subunit [Thermoanaerobaculia bacterium]|nr:efflux RND transporter periplasmic adaptor subunit [Thermoanaerobaculia bacterium]